MTKFTKCPHCQKVLKVTKFGATPKHKEIKSEENQFRGIPAPVCKGSNRIVEHSLYAPSKSNLDFSLVPYAFTLAPVEEAPTDRETYESVSKANEKLREENKKLMEEIEKLKEEKTETGEYIHKLVRSISERVKSLEKQVDEKDAQLEAIKNLLK